MFVLSVAEVVSFFFVQIFKMILLCRFAFSMLLSVTSFYCLVHHLSADDVLNDVE